MKSIKRLIWLLPALGAIWGGIEMVGVITQAQSAPQQAAGAAMACAVAILPYILARAFEEIAFEDDGKA